MENLENFEIESKIIECGLKPSISINNLSDVEKNEFFNDLTL